MLACFATTGVERGGYHRGRGRLQPAPGCPRARRHSEQDPPAEMATALKERMDRIRRASQLAVKPGDGLPGQVARPGSKS